MSTDERILRLENAFATLSELAARAQEVDERHEARLDALAESNRLIVELIRRHDERLDELSNAQAETGQKFAALVDAQIRAEDEMGKLRGVMSELAEAMAGLTRKVDAITGSGGGPTG